MRFTTASGSYYFISTHVYHIYLDCRDCFPLGRPLSKIERKIIPTINKNMMPMNIALILKVSTNTPPISGPFYQQLKELTTP